MNKKKILTLAAAIIVVVMAVSSVTLAYLSDTDNKDNVFTVGNVTIDLIEQQRSGDVDDEGVPVLEDFEQSKKLLPIVGSAQGEKDALGMPTAKNYVDKMVTIKNTGSEKAYIRAYFAIPSALDDGYETFNAGKNILHFNFGKEVVDGVVKDTDDYAWSWKHTNAAGQTKWNYFETVIDSIKYNVYYADYYMPLAAGATTERLINGVYLDSSFDYVDMSDTSEDSYYAAFGDEIELDDAWSWSNVKCPVFAVAVQAEGFASANEAVTAAFGAQYNPFGATATNWQ